MRHSYQHNCAIETKSETTDCWQDNSISLRLEGCESVHHVRPHLGKFDHNVVCPVGLASLPPPCGFDSFFVLGQFSESFMALAEKYGKAATYMYS